MFEKQKKLVEKRKSGGSFRQLKISDHLVDFCSNDYLGFSKIKHNKNLSELPVGSTGSRLLSGNYELIEQVEQQVASFHQAQDGLMFNSGYSANVGFFSSVPQKGDTVLYDELIHASVKDGIRLSFSDSFSFKHNNIQDLKKKLLKAKGDIYVVVEAIYSMDGDSAPLSDLVALSKELSFVLVVDEAHSVGVFGDLGEGLVVELGLQNQIPVRIVTFGKAIGCHGAMVLCDTFLKSFLINYSRAFIYSTALPPSSVYSIQQAYLKLLDKEAINALKSNIQYFNLKISESKIDGFIKSDSAIHCFMVPGVFEVKKLSENLIQNGLDIRPILSPTVKLGAERIRICLHSYTAKNQIDELFNILIEFNKNSSKI